MRALLFAAILAAASPAWAKSEKTAPYDPQAAFAVAVRFLRVDLGVTIVEKDRETGYVIFDLDEEKRTFRGALELVATQADGRASVRLILAIADRPEYEEQMMLDKLEQKRKAELEESPKIDRPAKPPDKPDGGDKPDKK